MPLTDAATVVEWNRLLDRARNMGFKVNTHTNDSDLTCNPTNPPFGTTVICAYPADEPRRMFKAASIPEVNAFLTGWLAARKKFGEDAVDLDKCEGCQAVLEEGKYVVTQDNVRLCHKCAPPSDEA